MSLRFISDVWLEKQVVSWNSLTLNMSELSSILVKRTKYNEKTGWNYLQNTFDILLHQFSF